MKKLRSLFTWALLLCATQMMADKVVALTADDISLANGETANLVVKMDYETSETVVGMDFSLYLPDGIVLDGFNTKEEQDAATTSAMKRACDLGLDGVWGEEATKSWLSVKHKTDGGLLFVLIDEDDKTPFESTKASVVTIKVKAIADVNGTGRIDNISISNENNVSLDLDNIAAVTFGINSGDAPGPQPEDPVIDPEPQGKVVALTADDISLANGETADLVVKMDYETTETVIGMDFSLYLPDGIILDGFDSKEAQDNAKASALKKACDLGEDGVWGEDATTSWLSVKQKTDGGLLFVLIDQDDKTPFESTKATLITIRLKAIADVNGTGRIDNISITNDENKSLDLNNISAVTFGINSGTPGPQPGFEPPANLIVTNSYLLNWLDQTDDTYKPAVSVTSANGTYGALTVEGSAQTLSMENFSISYYPAYGRQTYASLLNNATMRADNVSVDLQLRANRWEFLTFPFDVKVSDLRISQNDLPYAIRKYDGQKRADGLTNETWVEMTAESTLEAGQGYIFRIPAIFGTYATFGIDALQTVNKNNIFANDNVEVPLAYYESEFGHNRSWNLIGNPYPCFYDIRAMQTSAPIIVWNATSQSYEAYSPADDAYILTPGQAFFVQRPVDEESITFLKSGRQTNLTARNIDFAQTARSDMQGASRSVFNLVLAANGQSDRTRFVINTGASMGYETARDASKFQSLEPTAVQLYTIEDGIRYSINERPFNNGIVSLGMEIAEAGLYAITLDTKADQEVTLIDNMSGQTMRLDGNADGYAFTSEAGTFNSRFSVILGGGEVTGISNVESRASSDNKVYDLQGRRVNSVQKGVYVVNGKKTVVK